LSLYRETPISSTQTRGSRLWTRSKSAEPKWLFASANYNPLNQSELFQFKIAFLAGAYAINVKNSDLD